MNSPKSLQYQGEGRAGERFVYGSLQLYSNSRTVEVLTRVAHAEWCTQYT